MSFEGHHPAIADKKFRLTLTEISRKADNNQLYTLRLKLNPAGYPDLAPGMNTNVIIAYRSGFGKRLCVPLNALFRENGQEQVWVYDAAEGVVKSRNVTTGDIICEDRVEILSGLSGDEEIVTAGVHLLRENQKVEILKPVSETNAGGML